MKDRATSETTVSETGTVFELVEVEVDEPSLPAPPAPVLLFREPKPNRLILAARGLLAWAWARISSARTRIGSARARMAGARTKRARVGRSRHGPTLADAGRIRRSGLATGPAAESRAGSWGLWAAAAVAGGVWAVVGLIFWVPVLIGGVLRFSAAHLQAMIDGRTPVEAGARLRSAVSFYGRGFAGAADVARRQEPGPLRPTGRASAERVRVEAERPAVGRLLRASTGAAVVWYSILLALGVVGWPPVEVPEVSELALAAPWRDLPSVVGDGLATAVGDLLHAAGRLQVGGPGAR